MVSTRDISTCLTCPTHPAPAAPPDPPALFRLQPVRKQLFFPKETSNDTHRVNGQKHGPVSLCTLESNVLRRACTRPLFILAPALLALAGTGLAVSACGSNTAAAGPGGGGR